MKIIDINASVKYKVLIGENLLSGIGDITKELQGKKYQKIAVISDTNVFPLYGSMVLDSYESAGYDVYSLVFEAGENAKSFENLSKITSWLAKNSFTRTDLIVALGGGVCGDLSGFVSSVFLRGIDYIQVPTTLLSAIDSSVGGKTAINIPEGKNLVGSFWQPVLVVCDTLALNTLPDDNFIEGVAEAIKYGCIWDEDLFNLLSNPAWQETELSNVIARCVEIKAEVVAEDERDTGLRQILNFGHTFGHAIEKLSDLNVSHGQGVAVGMYIISKAGEAKGITEPGTSDKILAALNAYNLPFSTQYTPEQLAEASVGDKKQSGNTVNLILLEKIGKYKVVPTKTDDILSFLEGGIS